MKKKMILIVEDEKPTVMILEEILSEVGYKTFAVFKAEDAIRTIKEVMPDLVLLDIVFPTYDGFRIKDELNKDTSTASIPVIFLTVKNEISERVKGFHLGADDYIIKPFNSEELLARIDATLRKKSFYEEISMTDGLTGLYNIRFFKNQFTTFFNAAKRYKKTFSLVIFDINRLKRINDTHGHAAGDFVLKTFSSLTKTTFREADIVTRYGGDEFVVIMPETDDKQAADAVKRLKNEIDGKTFIFQDTKAELNFSVSAGIASYDGNFKTRAEMFRLADKRLYKDKNKKNI